MSTLLSNVPGGARTSRVRSDANTTSEGTKQSFEGFVKTLVSSQL
jgi:hypothetical protein